MKKGKQLVALVCVVCLLCSLVVGCTTPTVTTPTGSAQNTSTAPTTGTQTATKPTESATTPTTNPTEPTTQPTEPTQPTQPPTQPTQPPTQPTQPPTQPTQPPTQPTQPPTEPTEPPTEPTEPPTEPPTELNGSSSTDISASTMTKEEQIAMYQKIATGEAAWLASLQIENGALLMTRGPSGTFTMNPYFADFAALALLGAGESYYENVRRYMDWHFAHLNTAQTDYNGVDGTIYDYTVTLSNGVMVSEQISINANGQKSYDSTDSYAATFLCVVAKYYEKTGDLDYLQAHSQDLQRVLNPIRQTMHSGLTFAKPDYRIKYLMDNCEVYEGLVAAEKIYAALGLSELCAEATDLKNQVFEAIETHMWVAAGGYYEVALGVNNDSAYAFTWSNFYPCATAQLFPISCGLLEPTDPRAIHLYNQFNVYYSTGEPRATWEKMTIPDSFYWGSLAYTAALMGDNARLESYMTLYLKVMNRHAYPLYNADAARVCMAAQLMLEKLEQGGNK